MLDEWLDVIMMPCNHRCMQHVLNTSAAIEHGLFLNCHGCDAIRRFYILRTEANRAKVFRYVGTNAEIANMLGLTTVLE
jgi:hypothetical protein